MDLALLLPILVAIAVAIWAGVAYGRRTGAGPKDKDKKGRTPDA